MGVQVSYNLLSSVDTVQPPKWTSECHRTSSFLWGQRVALFLYTGAEPGDQTYIPLQTPIGDRQPHLRVGPLIAVWR